MNKLIPKPSHITAGEGALTLTSDSRVFVAEQLGGCEKKIGEVFPALKGCALSSREDSELRIEFDAQIAREGYRICVTNESASICASSETGVLYALMTLLQLNFFGNSADSVTLDCVSVSDEPRFSHRGLMLDEARHFFGKDAVKRLMRLMAFYKLNTFHWHLSDDQGWRIEIKKYPLLTEIGSKRKDTGINGWRSTDMLGEGHSGFYTQEDIREIVAYAKELNITIIPEIDMPAHFAAAMASYNFLGCREIPCEVHWFFGGYIPEQMGWKDWNRSMCAGKESSYEFVFGVLDELCELFDGKYIHIGGDEAPMDEWKKCPHCKKRAKDNGLKSPVELQGYFNNRIAGHIAKKGKSLIVWNEALAAGNLDSSVVGQYWTVEEDKNVTRHIKNGGKVIISKHESFYFDMCYNEYPLANTYMFEPTDSMIKPDDIGSVLGVEGELWTEWVDSRDKIDMQLFPRVNALAELGWTQRGKKDMDEFLSRLDFHEKILDALGVNYAEREIACVSDEKQRKLEREIWYASDQNREMRANTRLKKERGKRS